MKLGIKIKYFNPEENILEIGFFRGESLIHNVFYDIQGLSEENLLELKKEAAAKFAACFSDVPLKTIMKGFSEVDPLMQKLYKETFNPKGAGRITGKKIGKIKPDTIAFHRRVTPEEAKKLDEYLKKLRTE